MEKHTSAWGKGKYHLPKGQAAEGLLLAYWPAGFLVPLLLLSADLLAAVPTSWDPGNHVPLSPSCLMLFTDPLLARVPDTQFAHSRNVCWGPIFHDLRPLGLDLMMFLAQQGSPPLPTSQCVLLKNASRVMVLLPSKPCRGSHFALSKSRGKAWQWQWRTRPTDPQPLPSSSLCSRLLFLSFLLHLREAPLLFCKPTSHTTASELLHLQLHKYLPDPLFKKNYL